MLGAFSALGASCSLWQTESEPEHSITSARRFVLDYEVTLPPEVNPQLGPVQLWVPVPVSDQAQTVDVLASPEGVRWSAADAHGNRFCSLRWTGSEGRTLRWRYRIERREDSLRAGAGERDLTESEVFLNYLDPDSMVPSRGPAVEIAFEMAESTERADFPAAWYQHLLDRIDFSLEQGSGFGSSDYPIVEEFGDSTDFASAFIGGMRYQEFPARFQVGFLLPTTGNSGELVDPHAWAHWYRPERGWFPVDLAAADQDPERERYYFGKLGSNRVAMSSGRDLVLEPAQEGTGLNFFVAGYAEQDGREVRLDTRVRYYDL